MKLGIVSEVVPGETRVAATPDAVRGYVDGGFEVWIERGAGLRATFGDDAYTEAGAHLADAAEIWRSADVVLKVRPPASHPKLGDEVTLARPGQVLISLLHPADGAELTARLAERRVTAFALDCIPRISRAQRMDVLSSMANIAGYRAVIEASQSFGSFFTGQHTAAGSVPPAKVLIIGAGVAGLAALAAARSLGAIVRAFDTRAAVKEQVESLGGEFLTIDIEEAGEGGGGYAKAMSKEFIAAEMALFAEQAREVDIVITTALIPGKKAPLLWTEAMVKSMRKGSVVVDLAARNGGNCECTVLDEARTVGGTTVIGYDALPTRMPRVASELFARNVGHFVDELGLRAGSETESGADHLSGAEGRVPGAEGSVPGAKGSVSGAEGRVSGAEGSVSGAEGRVSGAEGRITGAEGSVSGAEGRVPGAEGRVSGAGRPAAAGGLSFDFDNEIVRGAIVTHAGEILWPPPVAAPPPPKAEAEPKTASTPISAGMPTLTAAVSAAVAEKPRSAAARLGSIAAIALVLLWAYLRFSVSGAALAPSAGIFLQHITVFILACFVGWQLVWNVSPALHTPLMSVTNAVSGIIIVGGLLHGHGPGVTAPLAIGAVATLFASINIFGGFWVTQRMLQMFQK